ncbi:MAG TPA: hypothetical protein VGP84_15780 [Gemmatimonadaceae bacterium]|jgi:hypothetical protein|nr:hypothetical protein [Gemmatimonadaceae bacterium]
MKAPSAEELLRVWEENQRAHPVRRALGALAAAAPERGWNGWERAPIGERDRALLSLYEHLFGSELRTTAACPQCGERLESEFSTNDIRSTTASPASPLRLRERGFDIEYRLPTSEDLLHIASARDDVTSDVELLLRRCVSRVQRGDVVIDTSSLPVDVIEHVTDGMAEHDPDADVRVALECPACACTWELHFDIVSYFWSELDDWAQRTLADVHALASAYGWSEGAVLALSPARRRIYLDMVGA